MSVRTNVPKRSAALLFGINYVGQGDHVHLKGCSTGMCSMRDFLVQAVPNIRVEMCTDDAACMHYSHKRKNGTTRKGMISHLTDMARRSSSDDLELVVIHYSGHGTSKNNCGGDVGLIDIVSARFEHIDRHVICKNMDADASADASCLVRVTVLHLRDPVFSHTISIDARSVDNNALISFVSSEASLKLAVVPGRVIGTWKCIILTHVETLPRHAQKAIRSTIDAHMANVLMVLVATRLSSIDPGLLSRSTVGAVVADYGGIWVGSRRSLRTPPSLNSDYHYGLLYQVPNGAFISATLDGHPSHFRPNQPEYLAHMANDAIHPTATGFENNCHLDESVCGNCRSVGQVVRSARVKIIAIRDIKAGEETLVSYGLQYWIKSYVPAMPSRTRDWLHVHELMESSQRYTKPGQQSTQSQDHQVATLLEDPDDRGSRLVYQRPKAIQAYDYEGPMYEVRSDHVDLLVTPNHRMYVRHERDQANNVSARYCVQLSEEVLGKQRNYKKNADLFEPDRLQARELVLVEECASALALPRLRWRFRVPEYGIDYPLDHWLTVFGILIAKGTMNTIYTNVVEVAAHTPRVKEALGLAVAAMDIEALYQAGRPLPVPLPARGVLVPHREYEERDLPPHGRYGPERASGQQVQGG
eukprot:gene28547-31708_t